MDWKGKVCIITGATSGIGIYTAVAMAERGMKLVLPVRSLERGRKFRQRILEETGNEQVELFECDLASMDSVRQFAADFLEKYHHLHLLINNAGTWETRRQETEDGIELTFAVNHLSHFLLTNLLLGVMKQSTPARIVNVSSMAHRAAKMNLEDPEGKKRWNGIRAYAQSKLANILFTRKLARMLQGTGITVNALHPGGVSTRLYEKMPAFTKPFIQYLLDAPKKGARTSIYVALSPEVEGLSGKYFARRKEKKPSAQALSDSAADRLWDISCDYTGLSQKKTAYGKAG
jgi:NAD(P)-dependent dehydrogenase (short-subunit alcohol dehydrogenase family)